MKNALYIICFSLFLLGCNNSSNQNSTPHWYSMYDDEKELVYEDKSVSQRELERNSIKIPYTEMYGNIVTIPVKINGMGLDMIFDTGASSTCITLAEAEYLYTKGTLLDDDIIGETHYQTADGNISVGLHINLRTVEIGDKIILHNVEALVVENQLAPLLLGQSVMKQFRETSIDRENQVVKFIK